MGASDDPAVKRAVLREHGIEVPERGRLSADHEAAYERLRQAPDDYDGGVTSADFGEGDDPDDDDGGEPAGEQVPRGTAPKGKAKRKATRQRASGLWTRLKKASGEGKKRHAWVGTSDVIEHFWSQLAWSARPIPPLQKILAAQAPTAGVILQDALRDTIVDRAVLQPAARIEDRLQAVNAMAGPPIWVMMIAAWGGAQVGPNGQPLLVDGEFLYDQRTQMMVSGLRFSLMSWLKISDKKAEDIQATADELTQLGDEADKLIRWILAPPVPGQSPKDTEREAHRRAAEFVGGQGEPDSPAPAAPPFAPSAFRPAPSAGVSGGPA